MLSSPIDPGLDRAYRHLERSRDLGVVKVCQSVEEKWLSLIRSEARYGARDERHAETFVCGGCWPYTACYGFRSRDELELTPLCPPILPEDVCRDSIEPGHHLSPFPGKAAAMSERPDKDLGAQLVDLSGIGPTCQVGGDPIKVPIEDHQEGLRILNREDQHLLIAALSEIHYPPIARKGARGSATPPDTWIVSMVGRLR